MGSKIGERFKLHISGSIYLIGDCPKDHPGDAVQPAGLGDCSAFHIAAETAEFGNDLLLLIQ